MRHFLDCYYEEPSFGLPPALQKLEAHEYLDFIDYLNTDSDSLFGCLVSCYDSYYDDNQPVDLLSCLNTFLGNTDYSNIDLNNLLHFETDCCYSKQTGTLVKDSTKSIFELETLDGFSIKSPAIVTCTPTTSSLKSILMDSTSTPTTTSSLKSILMDPTSTPTTTSSLKSILTALTSIPTTFSLKSILIALTSIPTTFSLKSILMVLTSTTSSLKSILMVSPSPPVDNTNTTILKPITFTPTTSRLKRKSSLKPILEVLSLLKRWALNGSINGLLYQLVHHYYKIVRNYFGFIT